MNADGISSIDLNIHQSKAAYKELWPKALPNGVKAVHVCDTSNKKKKERKKYIIRIINLKLK